MRKKILILGSTGMLGKDILDEFNEKGYEITLISRSGSHRKFLTYNLDLTNFDELAAVIEEVTPDVIINCAACVNLMYCEKNMGYAFKINSEINRVLISHSPRSCKIVYISTDSVFDGQKGEYGQEDTVNPLNVYAKTKLEGERVIQSLSTNFLIIRTNIYGFHKELRNSLAEWLIKSLRNDDNIKGYSNVYFNPLYTKQLSKLIYELVEKDTKGLIHAGSLERISKYEFCSKLACKLGYETESVSKGFLENNPKVMRPLNTTLDTSSMDKVSKFKFSIDDGIQAFYEDYMRSEIDDNEDWEQIDL